jgi:hypothetical protein
MFCAKMRAAMQRYAMRAHALFFARLLRRRRAFDAEVCHALRQPMLLPMVLRDGAMC